MTELEKILLAFEEMWTGEASVFKDAILRYLEKELEGLEREVYLSAGETMVESAIKLDEIFQEWYRQSLIKDMTDLIPNKEKIDKAVIKLNEEVNGIKLDGNLFRGLNFAQRQIISEIGVAFKDIGFNRVLRQSLMATTEYGLSLKEFRQLVKTNLTTTQKAQESRINQITIDAYSQLLGSVNSRIEENYNIKGYLYAPKSLKDNSRPLCIGYISEHRGYLSVEELPSFVNKYTSSKELSRGLVKDFDVNNLKSNTGKPGCRHTITPTLLTKEQYLNFTLKK